jgi:hypothetical protein
LKPPSRLVISISAISDTRNVRAVVENCLEESWGRVEGR